jgi:CDP-6-deoxy-D-xylo-4-hexulose-3-dehydrase
MRSHGWDRDMDQNMQKKMREQWSVGDFQRLYTFYYPGFNLRSTDLQAYIGLSQIDKLDSFKMIRNRNFHMYNSEINCNILRIGEIPGCFTSNFAYPVVNKKREEIIKALFEEKVEARPLIAGSMGVQPFWVKKYGRMNFENCDIIHKYGFYIPNHQGLSEDDICRVSKIINEHGNGGV